MAANQKISFMTLVSYSFLQLVLANTYCFATIQNVTDDRQTDREGLVEGEGFGGRTVWRRKIGKGR